MEKKLYAVAGLLVVGGLTKKIMDRSRDARVKLKSIELPRIRHLPPLVRIAHR